MGSVLCLRRTIKGLWAFSNLFLLFQSFKIVPGLKEGNQGDPCSFGSKFRKGNNVGKSLHGFKILRSLSLGALLKQRLEEEHLEQKG